TVIVNEGNIAPVLAAIPNQTVNEGSALTLTATATDGDVPADTLTFSLLSPPAGASIHPSTGVFTWTPTEAQGPGTYTIRVRVTDDEPPSARHPKSFMVKVNEVNTPPALAPIANRTIDEGATLTISSTPTDADVPANKLTFTLEPGAPASAN